MSMFLFSLSKVFVSSKGIRFKNAKFYKFSMHLDSVYSSQFSGRLSCPFPAREHII